MDKFEIVLVSQALKFYNKCPQDTARRLNKSFEDIEKNPFFGPNIKLLKSKERLYRYRMGDYRIVYGVDKENKKVNVFLISSRPAAYRNF